MDEWLDLDEDFDLPFVEEKPKEKKDYRNREMPIETLLENKGVKHLRELLELVK